MTTAVLQSAPTGYSESVWTALLRNPSALIGATMLALVLTLALLAGTLYPGDPLDMVAMPMLWPGDDPGFFLGSDSLGRDVAAGNQGDDRAEQPPQARARAEARRVGDAALHRADHAEPDAGTEHAQQQLNGDHHDDAGEDGGPGYASAGRRQDVAGMHRSGLPDRAGAVIGGGGGIVGR